MQNQAYKGLTSQQVNTSRIQNGTNLLTPPEKSSVWKQFIGKLTDPLIVILLVAGVLSMGISVYEYSETGSGAEFFEPTGIFIAIMLATGLSFYFERKADKEFAILNKVNDDEPVTVIREGNALEIPKKDVVVGDVVVLNTGDEVPADGVLLEAVSLHVDESSLTGEPLCEKSLEPNADPHATYPSNLVLRGTKVMQGHGVLRVQKVGDATENGNVYQEAQIDSSVKTPLNEQLEGLSHLISKLSYIFAAAIIVGRFVAYFKWAPMSWVLVVPTAIFFFLVSRYFSHWKKIYSLITTFLFAIIFIGTIWTLHGLLMPEEALTHLLNNSLHTLMLAVTLIVVAVPEGLPMAVTLSLAYSMRSMLKTNNLVRKLHACETMGATTVICTDKTGTLTENKMQVQEAVFYGQLVDHLSGSSEADNIVAEGIATNSTAELDLKETPPAVVGNPTEGALLLWLHRQNIDYRQLKAQATRLAELPFSTERKFMATIVSSVVLQQRVLYIKGAPEIVYDLCQPTAQTITRESLIQSLLTYQQQAMRTLGFAYYILTPEDDAAAIISHLERQTPENRRNGNAEIAQLRPAKFLGFTAISDPVRPDVPVAVQECIDAGIQIKIVTGDTPGTAKEIGRQIGLWNDHDGEEAITTGAEFASIPDNDLPQRVKQLKIIARARPLDKKRLVETLQDINEVVAVTGDGTNDAPALKAAHVGLSMGDGTSVAKEASDITIVDNSFASIGRAVMWGRSLYQNIQRFLLFQLTVNVSACLIVLAGAFLGTKSPLTVTQMLWVNLIMDTFGAMALASLPPSQHVMNAAPRDREAFILTPSLRRNVLGVGLAFFTLIIGFLYIFQHTDVTSMHDLLDLQLGKANGISPYEQTLLFNIFVWTHFWYMFNARAFETGRSVFHFKNCTGFLGVSAIIIVGQILIVQVLNKFFDIVPMHLDDWFWIITLSTIVIWIRELWHLLGKTANAFKRHFALKKGIS